MITKRELINALEAHKAPDDAPVTVDAFGYEMGTNCDIVVAGDDNQIVLEPEENNYR